MNSIERDAAIVDAIYSAKQAIEAIVIPDGGWQERAPCRLQQLDPDIFDAKQLYQPPVCMACPVKQECADTGEQYSAPGWWGGVRWIADEGRTNGRKQPVVRQNTLPCTEKGCRRKRAAKGLCAMHRRKQLGKRLCAVDDCGKQKRPDKGFTMCQTHEMQSRLGVL